MELGGGSEFRGGTENRGGVVKKKKKLAREKRVNLGQGFDFKSMEPRDNFNEQMDERTVKDNTRASTSLIKARTTAGGGG